MNIFKIAKEKIGYLIAAVVLSVAIILPGIVSAAQVTERSIGLSSASADADAVSYEVKFTVPSSSATRGAFGIIFCDNTPDTATACNVPTGLSTASASSVTSGFTAVTHPTDGSVVVAGTINPSDTIDVTIDGLHNPTAAGPLYARIALYTDATAATTDSNAAAFTAGTAGTNGIDNGGVAISITPTISVSGAVLESMTFCVANKTITENCGDAASNPPTLRLGEQVGTTATYALDAGHLSTGTLFTQLSTNASSGAVVYLKSSTDCGGLQRAGAAICDIAPTNLANVVAGTATFGVKTGTLAGIGTNVTGTIRPAGTYNGTTYQLSYTGANTGVTSPLGDLILDTNSLPVSNQQMPLIFGASVSNNTPAGNYSTNLSLIATGKF